MKENQEAKIRAEWNEEKQCWQTLVVWTSQRDNNAPFGRIVAAEISNCCDDVVMSEAMNNAMGYMPNGSGYVDKKELPQINDIVDRELTQSEREQMF